MRRSEVFASGKIMAQSIYLNLVTNPSGDNSPAVLAANSTLLQATLNVLWRAGAVVVVLLTLALAGEMTVRRGLDRLGKRSA